MIKKLYWIAAITTMLTVIVTALTFLVPTPEGQVWINFHGSLLMACSMVIVYIGAVVIFLFGLKAFTARFKVAYLMLCVGVITLAVAYMQIPVISVFQMLKSPWVTYGIVVIPFIVAIVVTYLGIRGFARLIGVKSKLNTIWLVMGISVACGIAGAFIPRSASSNPQQAHILLAVELAVSGLVLLSTSLAYVTRKHVGVSYMPAFAWLTFYMILSLCINTMYVAAIIVKPDDNWFINTNVVFMPYFLCGLILMWTAIEFNKVSAVDMDPAPLANSFTFFGKPKGQIDAQSQTPIDVILYMSNLASNVAAIDPILDGMRVITANMGGSAGGVLGAQQLQALAVVYRKLENYLTQQEQVRIFTKEVLRQTIKARFASSLAAYPQFWQYVDNIVTVSQPAASGVSPALSQPSAV